MVLTYKIWNFKPELSNVQTTAVKKTPAIGPRNNENIKSIFMPFQMVLYERQKIQGTTDANAMMDMTNFIASSKVNHVKIMKNDSIFLTENIGSQFIAFDFPTALPDTMYLTSILDLSYKYNETTNFKRMLIDYKTKNTVTLYLVADKSVLKVETSAKSELFERYVAQMNDVLINYVGIITNEFTSDEKTNLYVPEYGNHMKTYIYMADHINIDNINNAILDDQEHIIERKRKNTTTFFSNTGIVSIADDVYKYNNLSETDHARSVALNHLVKSFNFISKHGGYTDDYRLFSINNKNESINYQMFLAGLPVFSEGGLTEINVIWGSKEAYEYRRGLISTSVAIPSTETTKLLPTAEELRYDLAANKAYRFEDITQIALGYEMIKNDASDIQIQSTLTFEPGWYVQYQGQWMKFEDGRLK